MSDEGALREICTSIVEANPKQAATYRSGKRNVLGFFVGQVMKQTRGSANPKLVNQILEELLSGPEK
jgi:aspartyl-tRNA(Asn)/glutamyl-tRNA(Gln) amidotransferase subunit B